MGVQRKRKGFGKKIGSITYDISFHRNRLKQKSMHEKIIQLIGDMQRKTANNQN